MAWLERIMPFFACDYAGTIRSSQAMATITSSRELVARVRERIGRLRRYRVLLMFWKRAEELMKRETEGTYTNRVH